ncbi:hypothetical protein GQ53DRAFT_127835 [Thozetella sp. PMI_491]|nr:hypothetical protein GQ53DRAFT_127835 [Thozetella sp. PMI_491]
MRVSFFLSAFLATLAIATPVANPEAAQIDYLSARDTFDDTPEYTAAIKAHSGLVKDHYYWFTLEWPLGAAVGDGDAESKTELQQLQQKLGFEHVGAVLGQITETTTGKGKNQKTKRDYNAMLYHMVKNNVDPGDTELKSRTWKASSAQNLKWGGETSSKKITAAKKAGKDWVSDHKIYNVNGNNCNDFAQAVVSAAK